MCVFKKRRRVSNWLGHEYWRNTLPDAWSLPQFFKESGYTTLGVGKIFHPGAASGNDDVLHSWSPENLPYFHAKDDKFDASQIVGECGDGSDGLARPCGGEDGSVLREVGWMNVNASEGAFQDGKIALQAVNWLNILGKRKRARQDQRDVMARPFFLVRSSLI